MKERKYSVVHVKIRTRFDPPAVSPGDSERPHVAVVYCHGIGPIVPFEGIATITQAILGGARSERPSGKPEVLVDTEVHGEETVSQASFSLVGPDGAARDVSVFEAYWSPIPKGRVGLIDVIVFLVDAGLSGIRSVTGGLALWMFGRWERPPIARLTLFHLVVGLGLLVGLLLLNVSLGFSLLAPKTQSVLTTGQYQATVGLTAAALASMAALLVMIGLSTLGSWRSRPVLFIYQMVMYLTATMVAVAGLATIPVFSSPTLADWVAVQLKAHLYAGSGLWLMGVLAALTLAVRIFLVRYVGDVVAYISAHKVGKFQRIRNEIRAEVDEVFRHVYEQDFDEVIIVGHSLGTVIAYDALDAMINRELSEDPHLRVRERTRSFLTVGSPLDKTAFLFRYHCEDEDELREALAATRQPLLLDREYRQQLTWVNVWSPLDIVSGQLDYYHPPGANWPVRNVIDQDAVAPIFCHLSYFEHRCAQAALHQAVLGRLREWADARSA